MELQFSGKQTFVFKTVDGLAIHELSAKGIDHELVTLPALGHGFDTQVNAENSAEISGIFDRVTAFLKARV